MKCGYLKCNKDAGLNKKNGRERKYCNYKCNMDEANRTKREATKKKNAALDDDYKVLTGVTVEKDAYVLNVKHLEQALQGDSVAQQALKAQGLTYHYRKGEGEWGDATKTKESML